MNTTVDGEFQKYSVENGAYIREHFFGPDPRLRKMVEHLSDDDLVKLPRGGHDYRKLYAAYKAATEHVGSPTVILAKTVKGWTLGPSLEARNATHQIKKMTGDELKTFRDRLFLDIPDEACEGDLAPYYQPGDGLARVRVHDGEAACARRLAAGAGPPGQAAAAAERRAVGRLPRRHRREGAGVDDDRVRRGSCASCCTTPTSAGGSSPSSPTKARTFGLDALFPDVKIYSPVGQLYDPVDSALLLSYRESKDGRILEEGIAEAMSMASCTAVGTSYATWGQAMIPFFIFYSMFGFQRVGDLIWAFGDQGGKGFLLGATAGRTTLQGEGLQHNDGHSHVLATTVPNCRAYDPAFAYEMAVIIRDGIARMYGDQPEDAFYYLTLYNENYAMPPLVPGLRGGHRARPVPLPAGGGGAHAPRPAPRQRHRPAHGGAGAAAALRGPRRRRRRVERDQLQAPAGGRGCRPSAGTGCTRSRGRGCPT